MKNAVSEDAYIRVKCQLEELIKQQNAAVSKSLTDTLNFWDKVKYRWASAFKFNLHNITRSSLANHLLKAIVVTTLIDKIKNLQSLY